MDDRKRANGGWTTIAIYAALYTVRAAGQRREYLCEAAQRHRAGHPLLVDAAVIVLVGHVMGWWPRLDPLRMVGPGMERGAELVRRMSRPH